MTTSTDATIGQIPGGKAEKPQQIPPKGWFQVVKRGWAEAKADNVPLLAAGLAYYAFLAIFPTLTALVFFYGLFFDPGEINQQVDSLGGAVPAGVQDTLKTFLGAVSSSSRGAGIAAIVSVVVALWSASGGVNKMIVAINTAYDEEEKRSFIKARGLALLMTAGTIVTVVVVLALVAALPAVLQFMDNTVIQVLVQVARWVLLVVVIMIALAVLYRVAPDRDAPKMRWVSVGAGVATLLWVVASIGFSIYASYGSYNKYGALASVIVLLFWLWISAYAILLGAEINAESEKQTVRDTTHGAPQPLGSRDAVAADTLPDGDSPQADGQGGRGSGSPSNSDSTSARAADSHPSASSPRRKETTMSTSDSTPSSDAGASAIGSGAGATATSSAEPSVGDLVRQLSQDTSHLVRSEIQLAQAEMTAKAKKLGVGVGAFGTAGVLAIYGVAVLIATAILALALVLPYWLAALIIGVIVFVIAGVAALLGKKKVSQGSPPVPTQTIASVKEDVAEIKESAKR